MRLLLLVCALALPACAQADLDGRAGNRALEAGHVDAALGHYDDGLGAADTSAHSLRFRLQNNAALAELSRDSARTAFALADAATDAARTPSEQAEGAYHAGIAAAATGAAGDALARFRRAALLDPGSADAAYNWEVIARQQQKGGGGKGPGEGDDPNRPKDPSPPSDEPPPDAPPKPSPPDPSQAPPQMSEQEATRLLEALAREEAGLVRRTTRGTVQPTRPTKDW